MASRNSSESLVVEPETLPASSERQHLPVAVRLAAKPRAPALSPTGWFPRSRPLHPQTLRLPGATGLTFLALQKAQLARSHHAYCGPLRAFRLWVWMGPSVFTPFFF